MMKLFYRYFVLLVVLLSAGCANNPLRTHYINLKLAFLLNQDASVTPEEIKASKVDLAFIRSGDRPQAIIAKAFSEFRKDKWISNDKAMLVIKDHRVLRTLGFANDQITILSGSTDPLADIETLHNKRWEWQVDWSVGEYGYPLESSFVVSEESIDILGNSFATVHVVEEVTYLASNSLLTENSWENHYWVHKASGKLLVTHQQTAPFSDRFEITFVSDALRLKSKDGK